MFTSPRSGLPNCLSFSVLLSFLPLACTFSETAIPDSEKSSSFFSAEPYQIGEDAFSIEGDLGSFVPHFDLEEVSANVYELALRIEAPAPLPPPEFRLRWSLPVVDVAGFPSTPHGTPSTRTFTLRRSWRSFG